MEKELTAQQKYYLRNRDVILERNRKRYENDKDDILNKKKDYYKKNINKRLEYQSNYYKCPDNYKRKVITGWKKRNIKSDDYDKLYDYYLSVNNCELCDCELSTGRGIIGKKHLDHNHETGEFRNVLCGKCNINLNKIKIKSSNIINEEAGNS